MLINSVIKIEISLYYFTLALSRMNCTNSGNVGYRLLLLYGFTCLQEQEQNGEMLQALPLKNN